MVKVKKFRHKMSAKQINILLNLIDMRLDKLSHIKNSENLPTYYRMEIVNEVIELVIIVEKFRGL